MQTDYQAAYLLSTGIFSASTVEIAYTYSCDHITFPQP